MPTSPFGALWFNLLFSSWFKLESWSLKSLVVLILQISRNGSSSCFPVNPCRLRVLGHSWGYWRLLGRETAGSNSLTPPLSLNKYVNKNKFNQIFPGLFRLTTRSTCYSSSGNCSCPRHSIGSGRYCGLARWRWSCYQWDQCWRHQTSGRDCCCRNCAQHRPSS